MAFVSLIRASLLVIGVLLLCVGIWDKLVPRANYESSNPAPGAVLDNTPDSVTIQFSDALDQQSEISVTSTITLRPNGEEIFEDGKRSVAHGPSLNNAKALQVVMPPEAPKGLYWVQWKTVAARGKAQRFGQMCFAVGMPIPSHITRDMPGAIAERNYWERRYRAVLLSGVLLVALGVMYPQLARQR